MKYLYRSLEARKRPEDIADHMMQLIGNGLSRAQKSLLNTAAKGALRHQWSGYSSMSDRFHGHPGMEPQVSTAQILFETAYELKKNHYHNEEKLEEFIRHLCLEIGKNFGESDYKHDRLNRELRSEAGLELSKRQYNKLFRHLRYMEKKLKIVRREDEKLKFQLMSKSLLACDLSWMEFQKDPNSAYFIAYYTARCNLRSQFTIAGQERPFDKISEMLLQRAKDSGTANWWAIAHVMPTPEVLEHLSDEQKGELMGRVYGILQEIGAFLEDIWVVSKINRQTMVVKRGNDSTTWNNTAGAWNRARDAWVNLLYAMGMQDIMDHFCFGKVLRLMAADVVAWHHMTGGKLDPNTIVWQEIPLPWQVLNEEKICTREMIEKACQKASLNPERSGWTGPRPKKAVQFKPTPELVHGVTVSNPHLAHFLKKSGFFSGKKLKTPNTSLN